MLAKRLIHNLSVSMDAEENMINRLKVTIPKLWICAIYPYTTHLVPPPCWLVVWKYSLTVIALIFKFFCCSCICIFTVKMFSLINFCLDVGYIWWYTYLIKHTCKVTLLSCMMHYYQRQVAFHVLIGSWKDLFGWDVFGCRRNTTTLYTKENYVSELCRNNSFVYIPRLFHSFV